MKIAVALEISIFLVFIAHANIGGLQNAEILIKLQFKSPKHGSRLIEFVHFLSKMSTQMIMVKVI